MISVEKGNLRETYSGLQRHKMFYFLSLVVSTCIFIYSLIIHIHTYITCIIVFINLFQEYSQCTVLIPTPSFRQIAYL